MTPLNQLPSHGKAPCYVSVDQTGRAVLVANYGERQRSPRSPLGRTAGSATAKTIVQHEGKGPDPDRQRVRTRTASAGSRPIATSLAADLGVDGVLVYTFDERTASISTVATGVATKPGAGPRHLTFHPTGRFPYVINELDSTLVVYEYDGERGALERCR